MQSSKEYEENEIFFIVKVFYENWNAYFAVFYILFLLILMVYKDELIRSPDET